MGSYTPPGVFETHHTSIHYPPPQLRPSHRLRERERERVDISEKERKREKRQK